MIKKGNSSDISIIIKEAVDRIKLNMPPRHYQVILFGSWAKGNATYSSDIDLALKSEKLLDRDILLKVKNSIEQIKTLRKIDVLDFSSASPELKKSILKNGRTIYEI